MNIPTATYRLQFSPDFTFENARGIVSYLEKLGISHIYASPIFKARRGSSHGYDIADPRLINPELGGREGFEKLFGDCSAAGIGWVQDIVPNHMVLGFENPILVDVLENGPLSRYYSFFDIEWNHPHESLKGKVMIPVLAKLFGKCLEKRELRLAFDESGLHIVYHDNRFPLRVESYATVFGRVTDVLRDELGDGNPDLLKFLGVLYTVKNLPGLSDVKERYEQIGFVKSLLWEMYQANQAIRTQCDRILTECNGGGSGVERWSLLEAVLSEQHYRLRYWKTATQELNYRRFFTVNDLIAVRVEDDAVFSATHALTAELISLGHFQGLRIDHIDGLYDPTAYCESLRKLSPNGYIVVEKILGHAEPLHENWPIQGTTGYDFLNIVNRLFCSASGKKSIDRTYAAVTGDDRPFSQLVAEKKRLILGRHMAGDIDNLALQLKTLAGRDRAGIDITMYGLRRALVELLTHFPIYRTYVTAKEMSQNDRMVLKQTLDAARAANDEFTVELDYIESFLGLDDAGPSDQSFIERRRFIMRLQQFTGPLLAKGIEDTALYSYNRLVSLNEVGGDPELFSIGVKEFHEFCFLRASKWPHSMNATATHDTKRGEGTRARINVLSELGSEWSQKLRRWHTINKAARIEGADGDEIPVMNDEYLFYQTLIGSYPFEPFDLATYRSRVLEYMIKAIREAKEHSSWIRPNESYEEALGNFVGMTLASDAGNPFLRDFAPFQKIIAWYGMINSLAQTTLKMTAPGMPDFYQGTELWDFSLVDPDNRRPVDFKRRSEILDEIIARENDPSFLDEILSNPQDGRIKMFLIRRLLMLRKKCNGLFTTGSYVPLSVKGGLRESLVAFMRRTSDMHVLVAVPRLLTKVVKAGQMPLGRSVWGDTIIGIKDHAGRTWKNCLSGDAVVTEGDSLHVGDIMSRFPVAVLTS